MSAKHEAEQAAQDATRRARAKAEAEAAARRNDPELQARWAMALERQDGGEAAKAALSGFALAVEAFEAGSEGTAEAGLARRQERLAHSKDRAGRREAEPWEKDRRAALEAVRKALGRRADTADFDPLQALARGLVTDGKHLRALAPTLQIGLMAVAHRRRKAALLTPRQLAGLCAYHQAYLGMGAGVGAVDPARVRVDGGGAGDGEYARAMACDAARTFKALQAAVAKADPLYLGLLDHVVIRDQGIESYEDARTGLYEKEVAKAAIRSVMLVSAADALARQIGT